MNPVDQRCVDTIRFLAVDAVEKANSGHPGMPLGVAPMAYVLWDRFLRFNPANPDWFDRDRFLLSAGHGSALLYALLHVFGYDLSVEDLKDFRQWGSRTPGHPEHGHTPGVEATTGPLGQGFAMGVGMAMAESHLAATFSPSVVDHYTYAICSDGDLMEGVACEAASLAGTLKLGKLIYLYDDNRITIEGNTSLSFTEDVEARFRSYGWHTCAVEDGNDLDDIDAAIRASQQETQRPSLVRVRTHIGYGSPKQDSEKAHGEPLGAEGMKATRETLGWSHEPFHVPDDVRDHCAEAATRGEALEARWRDRVEAFRGEHAEAAATFETMISGGGLPVGWDSGVPTFTPEDGPIATRAASGKVLNALAQRVPTMMGGSADLAGSNKSHIDGSESFGVDGPTGRNIHFGVREHAMGAIVNGMALHGGVVPYGATFLIFSDYLRPSLRLAALMNVPSTFIFTHDSIGVGEDGPTHQPVEQISCLRAIPGFTVFRPADANETAAAWRLALARRGPCALALTRQKLPVLADVDRVRTGVERGAYVIAGDGDSPGVVIVATGSEVHIALDARRRLAADGIDARVVSMPSWELFREQDERYRGSVIPQGVPCVAVEAGSTHGWRDVIGTNGAPSAVIGIDRFGASAPGPVAMEKFGFTPESVAEAAAALIRPRNVTV